MIYDPSSQATVTITEAANLGWVSRYLYWWNPVTQLYNVAGAPDGELWPWYGYWVIAYIPVDLIISPSPIGGMMRMSSADLNARAARIGKPVPAGDKNIPMPPPPPPLIIPK